MNEPQLIDVLNRLLRTVCRSLAMYLEDAKPWTCRDDGPAAAAVARLVADRRFYAGRVAEAIVELGGRPDPGSFPLTYTAANDLSMDFLLGRLIQQQRDDVAAVQRCVADLAAAPLLRVLAEEILGNAKGHLEILVALCS